MALKRVIDTGFWTDEKVVEQFSPEDKLFMLYILTNPHSSMLGIYKISKKVMAFEIGYSLDAISVLLERFEQKYKIIKYSEKTGEIAIKNYLKYSVIKGGKPVEDCLERDIKNVKDTSLITYIFSNIIDYDNINVTIKNIINKYNIYYNGNGNGVSYHDTSNDTSEGSIYDFIEENFGRILTPIEIKNIGEWEEIFDQEIIKYAVSKAILNNAKAFSYINAILNGWKDKNYKSLQEIKENEKCRRKKAELFDYDYLNEDD